MHPKTRHDYVIQIRLDGHWRDVMCSSTERRAREFHRMMSADNTTRLVSRTVTITTVDEVLEAE